MLINLNKLIRMNRDFFYLFIELQPIGMLLVMKQMWNLSLLYLVYSAKI